MRSGILVVCFIIVGLSAFSQVKSPAFLADHNKMWVDSVFNTLSLEEKIGQLLLPRGNYSGQPHDVALLKKWITDYKIGGIVFFASNPTAQAMITNELQSSSKVPLLIGQDFEWGLGMRLDSTDRFPYAATLGAIEGNEDLFEQMGIELGKQCKRLGVHINYAPVVDVNNNPNNPVINFRSFGSDKYKVTTKSLAFMKGMQSTNLLCTAKHFPGHGDTDVDSHHDLPQINHDKARLMDVELYPFKNLIDAGLSGIMTAHLNIPSLEPTVGLASTFSKNIVYKLLREELQFKGLTFTDAMEMQGAVKNFPKGEAMVQALLAGNDILETFMDVPGTVEAIKKAIEDKRISMDAINFKVKKILMAKSWVGLDNYKPIVMDRLVEDLNTVTADVLNQKMTEKSITCIKNDKNLLPIQDFNKKIAVLSIESVGESSEFYKMISNYASTTFIHIPKNASDSLISSALSRLSAFDLVIAGVHFIDIRSSRNYGLTPQNTKLITQLASMDKVVLCLFGNPFILTKVPQLSTSKTFLLAYQQTTYSERAAAQMIFGALSPQGSIPFTFNEYFNAGDKVTYPALDILSYGLPEQVGVDRSILYSGIDSLVFLGLREKAYPGVVVQVAKDGKVIFSKSYGYHTYEEAQQSNREQTVNQSPGYTFIDDAMDNPTSLSTTLKPITTTSVPKGKMLVSDIFDLASVTKISTSTLAVMQLMSEGKFDLNEKFGTYYKPFQGIDKGELKMKDLLTHRAGLKAWIPFWRDAIDTIATLKRALENHPDLENQFVVKITKPGFFKRLFGKKPTKEILYAESIQNNPRLWQIALTPENRTWKKNIFSTKKSSEFSVPVDNNMFLHKNYKKQILKQIADSPLNPTQGYVYSDLHYYVYPDMIESMTGRTFENYLRQTYDGLGAKSLVFNPLNYYPKEKIVPTEYDSLFRQLLIHGYVHDEGAAMMSGISGHAGLFGNANDLNKLMQMYLQKGKYAGKQFIKPEVLVECTSYQFPEEKNRRGIGFDKKDFNPNIKNAPSLSSNASFGHSGFTGTFTWIDPVYNTVYVFMSNRVYPTRDNSKISQFNIRSEIGNIVIQSIQNKNNQ